MDVVDTLRHQDNLVARELNESEREAELLERLRQIYRGQGIEVPDRVLREGVAGAQGEPLRLHAAGAGPRHVRSRKLWVSRGRIGKGLLAAVAALGIGAGAYYVGVVQPARAAGRSSSRPRPSGRGSTSPSGFPPRWSGRRRTRCDEAQGRRPRASGPSSSLADGRAALNRRDAAGRAAGDHRPGDAARRPAARVRAAHRLAPERAERRLPRPGAQPQRPQLLPHRRAGRRRTGRSSACR